MPRRTAVGNAELLFELYEQKMYRIAFAILHDVGQAEDAIMAAFEKILRSNGVPPDPEADDAKRLVMAAVRSTAIDQYRKNARERQRTTLTDDVATCEPATAAPAADPMDAYVDAAHARQLVAGLPEPYGAVLRERYLNDQTTRQTAERLGISEPNVRKRQQRALGLLRDQERRQGNEKLSACE